ncbi:hypothetical protein SRB17_55340 [Streptomyces sp. RB17]|nr:hypothetical protein [Streptomyces sp. RB17]
MSHDVASGAGRQCAGRQCAGRLRACRLCAGRPCAERRTVDAAFRSWRSPPAAGLDLNRGLGPPS